MLKHNKMRKMRDLLASRGEEKRAVDTYFTKIIKLFVALEEK